MDNSQNTEIDIKTSTPKSNLDSRIYASPVSPLYKSTDFSSPKRRITPQKSPLCLGDFIVKRPISKGKNGRVVENQVKRRINPTNISSGETNSFYSENSFNFSNPENRELSTLKLSDEKIKIMSQNKILSSSTTGLTNFIRPKSDIKPDINLIKHKKQLDIIISVYTGLLDYNYVLNLTSEMYFLISLLIQKTQNFNDLEGVDILPEHYQVADLFTSIHNVVYFASKTLENQVALLQNFDNSTLKLLLENDRLTEFAPSLHERIKLNEANEQTNRVGVLQHICFNSDTDNRRNFPNDPSFHAFRKQRDLFYDILRLWESQHLTPGFTFSACLGGKIRTLFGLCKEPANYVHFVRLFKAQLLSSVNYTGDSDLFTIFDDVNADKLSKLRSRCVNKDEWQDVHSVPKFTEIEEFYKDFITTAGNFCFYQHMQDALIQDITEMNETNFYCHDVEYKGRQPALHSYRQSV